MISAWGVDHGYDVVEKAIDPARWGAAGQRVGRKLNPAVNAGRRARGRAAQGGRRAYGAAYGVTNRAIGGTLNAGSAGASRVRGAAGGVRARGSAARAAVTNPNQMYAAGAGLGYRLNPAVNATRSAAGNRGVQFGAAGAGGAAVGGGATYAGTRRKRRS